jgi:hypothetical protein
MHEFKNMRSTEAGNDLIIAEVDIHIADAAEKFTSLDIIWDDLNALLNAERK